MLYEVITAWRRATLSNLKKNFVKPVAAALVAGAALFPFLPLDGRADILAYIAFILCVFVMGCILSEFFKGTAARMDLHEESPLAALSALTWRNKRRRITSYNVCYTKLLRQIL